MADWGRDGDNALWVTRCRFWLLLPGEDVLSGVTMAAMGSALVPERPLWLNPEEDAVEGGRTGSRRAARRDWSCNWRCWAE